MAKRYLEMHICRRCGAAAIRDKKMLLVCNHCNIPMEMVSNGEYAYGKEETFNN